MADPVALLTESSLRAAVMVVAMAVGIALLRPSPAAARRIWAAGCVALLTLPLLLTTLDLDLTLPDFPPPTLEATAGAGAGVPAPAGASTAPWERVRFRPRPSAGRNAVQRIYLAGVAVAAALLCVGVLGVARRRRRSESLPPELTARLPADLTRRIEVRISREVTGPVLAGWWRGAVLLPPSSRRWGAVKLRSVLAHEIDHRDRRDPLWLLLAHAARCLFWFHPGAWWLVREIQCWAERAADEAGADAVGRAAYGRCLAEIALEAGGGPSLALAPSMARRSLLPERLRHLARSPGGRRRSPLGVLAGCAVLLTAAGAASPVRPVLPAPEGFHREAARLASFDAEERAEALYRLGRWPGQERRALPLLVAHLGDDAPIPAMPRWHFEEEGWAPALVTWHHPSPGEVAARALASMSRRAAPALEAALDSPQAVVRRNGAWALGELRHPRGVSRRGEARLIRLLRDRDPGVRAAAAWALGDLGTRDALPALLRALAREADADALRRLARSAEALRRSLTLEDLRLAE